MRQTTLIYSSNTQDGLLRFVGPYRAISADLSISGSYYPPTIQVISPSVNDTLVLYGENILEFEVAIVKADDDGDNIQND